MIIKKIPLIYEVNFLIFLFINGVAFLVTKHETNEYQPPAIVTILTITANLNHNDAPKGMPTANRLVKYIAALGLLKSIITPLTKAFIMVVERFIS